VIYPLPPPKKRTRTIIGLKEKAKIQKSNVELGKLGTKLEELH